jgi:cytochrome P450
MTRAEIMKTNSTLIMAGSETSATLLSGATFLLLKNKAWLVKLQDEMRSLSLLELTFASVSRPKVLNANIQETFRMYPPASTILPCHTPEDGALIDGVWIPGGISVGIAQYPANMSSRNFTNSDTFAPERWLGDKQYENDGWHAVQAFSVGPRNCLGQVCLVLL